MNRQYLPFGLATALTIALACLLAPAAATAQPYEQPPVLSAADFVPAERLTGDHYRIADEVASDGFMNTYHIDSDFGAYDVYGSPLLAIRIREMSALAQLAELSKSDVFMQAVKESATGQLKTIGEFATHPVETIKGLPGGAKKLFKITKRKTSDAVDTAQEYVSGDDDEESAEGEQAAGDGEGEDEESTLSKATESSEKIAKQYLGVNKAMRRWSERLGVDPYTSNEPLREAIEVVAKVDSSVRFGMRFVPIPRIPGVSAIGTMNKAVWGKDPYELLDMNTAMLREMGADEEAIEAFFGNPWYSPSRQTLLIGSLDQITDAENRVAVLGPAIGVKSDAEAGFLTQSVALLAWLHRNEAPVARLIGTPGLPFAVTTDHRVFLAAATDHVVWTEELAGLATERSGLLAEVADHPRELWLFGTTSSGCRQQLEAQGWRVHDQQRARFKPAE